MRLGGFENEEYLFECKVLQSCRKTWKETSVDCGWSQDPDHGLLHPEDRDAVQRAWQGLSESETGR